MARRYGFSQAALQRHAAHHLPAQLAKAADAAEVADAGTLLGRVERLERRAWELLDLAETKARAADATPANLQAASALVGKLTSVLELLGRISGELVERRLVGHVHRVDDAGAMPSALALQLAAEELCSRASELDEATRRALVVRLLEPPIDVLPEPAANGEHSETLQ